MSNRFLKLWVDDERPPPDIDFWDVSRNFHEAITKLDLLQYDEISLDHDIASFYGDTEMTGYHIVKWLVQRKLDGKYVPTIIRVHSANIIGSANMVDMIEKYLK